MRKNRAGAPTAQIRMRQTGRIVWKISRFVLLLGLEFLILYPFLYMLITAFRGMEDLNNPSVVWITRHWTLEHIQQTFLGMDYAGLLGYTLQIGLVSALLQAVVCGVVGYGFARFRFPGKGPLFALVIFTIIVPPQTYLTPLFMMFRLFEIPGLSPILQAINPALGQWNLLDTPWPFWIQSLFGMDYRSGLFIFIFRQFFRSLPQELEDAAAIDGAGAVRTYTRVMLPNVIPSFLTVGIFSLVWHWNDYFMPSMLSMSRQTVATALATLRGTVLEQLQRSGGGDETLVMIRVQAGALLSILPLLILFIVAQRYFTEGIERSGIVG